MVEEIPLVDAAPSADGRGISREMMLAQTINNLGGIIGVGESNEVGWLRRRQLVGARLSEEGWLLHREASPTADDDNLYTEEWEEYGAGDEEEVAACIKKAIGSDDPAELVAAAAGVLPASVAPPPIHVPTSLSYRHRGHLPLPGPALSLPSPSSAGATAALGHHPPQSPTVSSSSRSSSVAGSAGGGRRHSGRQRSGGTPGGPDGIPLMDSLRSILDNA